MTASSLSLLLMAGFVCLIGVCISGMSLTKAHKANEKRDKRLDMILAPHLRATQLELSAFLISDVKDPKSPRNIVAGIFGYNPERASVYPVPWFVVLPVTFLIAFVGRFFMREALGGISWLALPILWILLSRWFFNRVEAKRRSALLNQFPDALAMIVRSIRVGVPVIDAIRNVSTSATAPTSVEFARLVEQISLGNPLDEAILELSRRTGLPEYRFFSTSLALQTQTGGALSETLENLADVIRKRAALKARGLAATAEARTSSWILGALPIVVGLMLMVTDPPYIMLLFTHPTGKTILSVAIIFLLVGMMSIKAIIKSVLP